MENEQEKGISLVDFCKVLFGRKVLLCVITALGTIAGAGLSLVINKMSSTYVGTFVYNVDHFNSSRGKYYDGSTFDMRDMYTYSKLKSYQESNESLSDIDPQNLYVKDFVNSITWETTYKEVPRTDSITQYVEEESYYKIVITKNGLTYVQAASLAQSIANEVIKENNKIVESTNQNIYLNGYDTTYILENKVEVLKAQFNYINKGYSSLMANFGDIIYTDENNVSSNLSIIQNKINAEVNNVPFDSLLTEIRTNYLATDEGGAYKTQLLSNKKDLEENLAKYKAELLYWETREDDLIASVGTALESLELSAIHSNMIALEKSIVETESELSIVKAKLEKLNLSPVDDKEDYEAYQKLLNAFITKLEAKKRQIEGYTTQYTNVIKHMYAKYSKVYFGSGKILQVENAVSLPKFTVIGAVLGLVVGFIVNLSLDGSKLSQSNEDKSKKAK